MDPITGAAVISAGSSLLGGLMGNSSAKKAAKAQMAFQERMDNTKYQRGVADMRAAGINPMLVMNNGVGGAPSGALARVEDPITPAVNTALSAMKNKAEVENMQEQNNNLKTQNDLNKALIEKAGADAGLSNSASAQARANTLITNLQTVEQHNKNKIATAKGMLIDEATKAANSAKDALNRKNRTMQDLSPAEKKENFRKLNSTKVNFYDKS